MITLQRCTECGAAQYPRRVACRVCVSERLEDTVAESLPGRVLARTVLHHSNEPRFRPRLPLTCALVQFDAGPIAVCFLVSAAAPGDAVQVRQGADQLLEA